MHRVGNPSHRHIPNTTHHSHKCCACHELYNFRSPFSTPDRVSYHTIPSAVVVWLFKKQEQESLEPCCLLFFQTWSNNIGILRTNAILYREIPSLSVLIFYIWEIWIMHTQQYRASEWGKQIKCHEILSLSFPPFTWHLFLPCFMERVERKTWFTRGWSKPTDSIIQVACLVGDMMTHAAHIKHT